MLPFRQRTRTRMQDTILLSGWLFADLLLALSVIFLVNNTSFHVQARPLPTPSPTQIPTLVPTPSPTPKPLPRLELAPHRINIVIDSPDDAGNLVTQKIQKESFLAGRTVGMIIIYTSAADDSSISAAQQTDENVKSALKSLTTSGFANATYYDNKDQNTDLYFLGDTSSSVTLDIFLYKQ